MAKIQLKEECKFSEVERAWLIGQTRLRAMGKLSDDDWRQFNQIVQRGLEIIEGKGQPIYKNKEK